MSTKKIILSLLLTCLLTSNFNISASDEEISRGKKKSATRDVPVSDFSNLPTALQDIINDDNNFSSGERSTITGMNTATRISNITSHDELTLRYMSTITSYCLNEIAKTIFNPAGGTYVDVYMIPEGMVSNDVNEIMTSAHVCPCATFFGDCNSNIFGLFIGLSDGATLTTAQETDRDNLYAAVNADTGSGTKIADRKYYRRIHPVVSIPT